MDYLVLAVVAIAIGALGLVIGLRLARRLDRWVDRDAKREGDDE